VDALYLGVAREIITPELGGQLYGYRPDIFSESVADDLTATAFYFKQGNAVSLLISATVCAVSTEFSQRTLDTIEQQLGIPGENCILCATHTHSGPNLSGGVGWGDVDTPYFETIFLPQVLSAAKRAMQAPVPVTMGVASGNSYVGINRRELTLENKIILGQNEWGSFNPRMLVMSFRDENGKNVANIIHYGAHCTAAGQCTQISRDWAGVMIDGLEAETGAMTAFVNGPEGDIGPRLSNGKTIGNMDLVRELGAVAAQDAIRIYGQVAEYKTPQLQVCANTCAAPLQPRMPLEEARAMYEKYKERTVNMSGRMKHIAQQVINAYEQGTPEETEDSFLQTAIALDNVVLVAFPYELFSEIGLRIDKAFPEAEILPVINANGSKGYFITQDAICRGGYEVNYFLYGAIQGYREDADWYLLNNTVENIRPMIEKE